MQDSVQIMDEVPQEFTYKQWVFIAKYFELGFNGAKAARAAKYKAKSARQMASENLSKPYIRDEINRRMETLLMGENEVLTRLAQHARGDMRDFINKSPKALANHPDGNLIKKYKRTVTTTQLENYKSQVEERVELELYDAQAALVHIGRHHKLFTDRADLTSDNAPIAINFVKVDGRPANTPDEADADAVV